MVVTNKKLILLGIAGMISSILLAVVVRQRFMADVTGSVSISCFIIGLVQSMK